MIVTTEISGTLPTLKDSDLLKMTENIGSYVLDEVRLNFGQGGRPIWLPLAKGGPSFLFKGGALLRSIAKQPATLTATGSEVIVGTTGGLPYAWIHQEGGYAGKNRSAYIPPRPYMMLPESSIKHIVDETAGYLTTILNNKGEKIA